MHYVQSFRKSLLPAASILLLTAALSGLASCSTSLPKEVEKALAEEKLGNYQTATNILTRAEKKHPQQGVYPYHLGNLYNRNYMKLFKGKIRTIAIEDPDYKPLRESVMMRDTRGRVVGYMLKDLTPIIKPYLRAIEKSPDLVDAWLEAASLYAEMNSMRKAFDLLEKGSKHFPKNYRFPFLRGFLHTHIRNYRKGVKFLRKAGELNPDFSGTFRYLGEALLALGETGKAHRTMQRVLDLGDNKKDMTKAFSTIFYHYYDQKKYKKAALWGIQNRDYVEDKASLQAAIGKACYISEQEQAKEFLESAYEAGTKDALLLAMLGQLAVEETDYRKAEKYFKESLKIRPRIQVLYQLGSLYMDKFNSPGRAIPYLEKVAEASDKHYMALYQLARAYQQAEKPAAEQKAAWERYLEAAIGNDRPEYVKKAQEALAKLEQE